MNYKWIRIFITMGFILVMYIFTKFIPIFEREIDFNSIEIKCVMKKDTLSNTIVALVMIVYAILLLFLIQNIIFNKLIIIVYYIQAHLTTFNIISIFKTITGKLRPDFIQRCQPINNICTGIKSEILDGRESFPSGHTSLISCTLIFYFVILQKYKKITPQSIISLFILLFSSLFVLISRIIYNKHFIFDVICGFIFGSLSSFFFAMRCIKIIKNQNKYYEPCTKSTDV